MRDTLSTFTYRIVSEDGIDAIQPLWEELRAHHAPLLSRFSDTTPPLSFARRKQEILTKAAAGKVRIELVSTASVDVAYCLSTVSSKGQGELDSIFVEKRFRSCGIGSELIHHALDWLDRVGASSKVVTVAHANQEALKFYQRFGFQPRTILLQK